MNKKFDDNNDFINEEKENKLEEIIKDDESLIDDEINHRKDYDDNYRYVIEEVVSDLNKKNKRKNRIMFTVVACTSLFAFTSGFLANRYLDNKISGGTQELNYQVNTDKYNSKDNDKILKEEDMNKNDHKVDKKENLSTEEVVKLVSPAVVTVSVTSQGSMFSQPKQGVGTGFIVDEDGTVVTNYHVIDGATDIVITFNDGTEVNANIVATSKKDDLAILDIIDEVKMPGIAELAQDDEVNAGQEVIAIGNPLGKEFSGSVTKGIISSPKRMVNMDGFDKEFIQIDAAINPGNSGGPLINLKGEIIGVNTAKQGGEDVEGIGFSVAIKYVREMLNNPESYTNENGQNQQGQPNWNYPEYQPGNGFPGGEYPGGNQGQYPGSEYGYRNDENTSGIKLGVQIIQTETGLVVVGVERGSVAERAGIQINDVIIGVDGIKISSVDNLKEQLSLVQIGQSIELNVGRNGQAISLIAVF